MPLPGLLVALGLEGMVRYACEQASGTSITRPRGTQPPPPKLAPAPSPRARRRGWPEAGRCVQRGRAWASLHSRRLWGSEHRCVAARRGSGWAGRGIQRPRGQARARASAGVHGTRLRRRFGPPSAADCSSSSATCLASTTTSSSSPSSPSSSSSRRAARFLPATLPAAFLAAGACRLQVLELAILGVV